ncbi:MAG: recombinase family protein [Pseudomonadota bacterium]
MSEVAKLEEAEIWRRIKAREFKDCYLTYNRKSTDEADSQKNSIVYQDGENIRYAERENLRIAPVTLHNFCQNGIITEKHSGFKESYELTFSKEGEVQYRIERPKFQRLVQFLNEGYFKGIICLCWDRASRNRGDDTVIRKLHGNKVDFRFVTTKYDNNSAGELHMDIDGVFSVHHSRQTSEKVTATTKHLRSEGKCTYKAPIGYLNTGSTEDKPLDPERAPIIKDLFQLYATGGWSIPDLARYAEKQGLRTVPARPKRTKEEMLADTGDGSNMHPKVSKPLRAGRIGRILRNPFYVGLLIGPEGTLIPSKCHEPLVDIKTFEKVQILLTKRRTSKYYEKKKQQPFRGFVRCNQCKRVFTPYTQKGITYYSSRCLPDCPNTFRNCNYELVNSKICALLAQLTLSEAERETLDAQASAELALLEERHAKETARRERQKVALKEDLTYLRKNQLSLLRTGVYSPETLQEERETKEQKLVELATSADGLVVKMRALIKDVLKYSELLNNVTELYDLAKPLEKDELLKKVSSELLIDQNTAQLSPQIGLEPVFCLKKPTCEPTEWFSELIKKFLD